MLGNSGLVTDIAEAEGEAPWIICWALFLGSSESTWLPQGGIVKEELH